MIKKFYQFLNESGGFMDVLQNCRAQWNGVLSKDDVMDIKDVFTFLISDEIDMEDLSDKDWHNDDDSIHDICPEFIGQSFFAFYEKISKSFPNYVDLKRDVGEIKGITILIKYGTDIYESEYDDVKTERSKVKEEKLKKCIKEFQKRIVDMGYGCKTGKFLDAATEYGADTITMYIIEIGIN